jgi:hypothetical protein
MTIVSFYMKKLDFVGNEVSLLHKSSKRVKTVIGGIITSIISIFTLYCAIYFGRGILTKDNPSSRFSKSFTDSSRVRSVDRPYVVYFANTFGVQYTNPERYFTLTGLSFPVTDTGLAGELTDVFMDKCDIDVHLAKYKDLYANKNLANALCSNPHKMRYHNGTVVEYDSIYFENEYIGLPSVFIAYSLGSCVNTTENGNKCAPQEEIDQVENGLYMTVLLLDEYINLNDYEKPSTQYIYPYTINISPKVSKNTHVVYKNTYITTDAGLIMEDPSTINISQIDSLKTVQITTGYYIFYFESTKITDNYNRKYVKIQDLVASIGGLIKFIYVFSSILISFSPTRR